MSFDADFLQFLVDIFMHHQQGILQIISDPMTSLGTIRWEDIFYHITGTNKVCMQSTVFPFHRPTGKLLL